MAWSRARRALGSSPELQSKTGRTTRPPGKRPAPRPTTAPCKERPTPQPPAPGRAPGAQDPASGRTASVSGSGGPRQIPHAASPTHHKCATATLRWRHHPPLSYHQAGPLNGCRLPSWRVRARAAQPPPRGPAGGALPRGLFPPRVLLTGPGPAEPRRHRLHPGQARERPPGSAAPSPRRRPCRGRWGPRPGGPRVCRQSPVAARGQPNGTGPSTGSIPREWRRNGVPQGSRAADPVSGTGRACGEATGPARGDAAGGSPGSRGSRGRVDGAARPLWHAPGA